MRRRGWPINLFVIIVDRCGNFSLQHSFSLKPGSP